MFNDCAKVLVEKWRSPDYAVISTDGTGNDVMNGEVHGNGAAVNGGVPNGHCKSNGVKKNEETDTKRNGIISDAKNDYVKTDTKNGDVTGGRLVEVEGPLALMTLNNLMRCAMSIETNCQTLSHPFVNAVRELAKTVSYRLESPWRLFLLRQWIFDLTPKGRRAFGRFVKTLIFS